MDKSNFQRSDMGAQAAKADVMLMTDDKLEIWQRN